LNENKKPTDLRHISHSELSFDFQDIDSRQNEWSQEMATIPWKVMFFLSSRVGFMGKPGQGS
jgi:hypothetical protein